MPKCPSEFCGKDNPEGSVYCGECGIDLKMDRDEVQGRDLFYSMMIEFAKENPKFKDLLDINRGTFYRIMEGSSGRIFLMMAKIIAQQKVDDSKPKKDEALEIEKEKLKVLKEIKDALKEKKSKHRHVK